MSVLAHMQGGGAGTLTYSFAISIWAITAQSLFEFSAFWHNQIFKNVPVSSGVLL
jgi:low affinity Fe/Cu permease